jgi:hypothetical protein
MSEMTTILNAALEDEPPLGFAPEDVVRRARSRRRKQRGLACAIGALGAAGMTIAALTVATAPHQAHLPSVTALSVTDLAARAAAPPTETAPTNVRQVSGAVDGLSSQVLPTLIQQDTGVTLTNINVTVLPPAGALDFAAGIDVAGTPYLNVQIAPAYTLITETPTCAALSDAAGGTGDGYAGPCTIQRLADGTILVVRSGQTARGGYTMAQAVLIHPDGSGIFAEDTNQTVMSAQGISKLETTPGKGRGTTRLAIAAPRVVREEPVLDAQSMAHLVRSLDAQARH